MSYTVLVDDNFHYMDADERYTHGEFESLDAAIIACKEIVDDYLRSALEPGMPAGKLYLSFVFVRRNSVYRHHRRNIAIFRMGLRQTAK